MEKLPSDRPRAPKGDDPGPYRKNVGMLFCGIRAPRGNRGCLSSSCAYQRSHANCFGSNALGARAASKFNASTLSSCTGEGQKRAHANGVKFGRKPKLSDYQRKEAIKRRAAGETLAEIAKSYAVDISMISRLT
jgi:hypothetical protein